jgi:hypothetical protein
MYEVLFVHRAQTGGDLDHNFESQLHLERAGTPYEFVQRLPIDEFHRVEVTVAALPKVEHRSDVRVTHTGRSAGLPDKAPSR